MRCPYCQHHDSKVLDTSHDSHGGIRRRRECFNCGQRFSTYERPILATPLIVKQDGTREEFDREKMARGIRISCAKRPVSAADIERMIGQVEAAAGRDEDALVMLRRAVTLDPGLLEARYALSRALLRLGRTEEAQQELRVFEAAQAKAMDEQRRQFLENQQKIDSVLENK